MLTKAGALLPVLSLCATLSAACVAPTPEPIVNTVVITRVVEQPAGGDVKTVLVTATPSKTLTPNPTVTPTIEPRSWQEVWVDCKQDENAKELSIEVRGRTTIGDVAGDPAIADCYGETIEERAVNIARALAAAGATAGAQECTRSDATIRPGTYSLFLRPEAAGETDVSKRRLVLVSPTPTATPTLEPTAVSAFLHPPVSCPSVTIIGWYDHDPGPGVKNHVGDATLFRPGHATGTEDGHNGIDYGGALGTPIQAAADGTVLVVGWVVVGPPGHRSKMIAIEIDHHNGYLTGYYHLQDWLVDEGDTVQTGDVIAHLGNTGGESGYDSWPHLHFNLIKEVPGKDPRDLDSAGLYLDPYSEGLWTEPCSR